MTTEKRPVVTTTIRIPAELHEKLKAAYWRTVPKHRLSYNAWICSVLDGGLVKKS